MNSKPVLNQIPVSGQILVSLEIQQGNELICQRLSEKVLVYNVEQPSDNQNGELKRMSTM